MTTSGSSRSARTGPPRAATGRVVALGDLASEQVVEVVLRLSFPYGDLGRETGAIVAADRPGRCVRGGRRRRETRAGPADLDATPTTAANDAQPRDRDVDRAVARLFAARARQEAVRRNRDGDFIRARRALTATAERDRSYAGDDP